MSHADVEALKAFIDDNEELDQLETILDHFNIFKSLDLVRQEIRHSAFLRWLLDPSETHGLGDYWLRQLLRRVISDGEGSHPDFPSLFDLDDWNLGNAEVLKEWRNIDILILDEENRFVCAIENKVDSGEHSEQLQRYRRTVEQAFGDYKKAFVFLTISGEEPSEESYVPLSYTELASIIESALRRREGQLNDEIRLFVQQYLDMVRRYIVEESDVQELCRRIYRNHHQALDLIFDHRPDRAAEVSQVIQDYIGSRDDLISEQSTRTLTRFLPRDMDVLPHEGTGEYVRSKRMLLWELDSNRERGVELKLVLGPGSQHVRKAVYEKAERLPQAFGKVQSKLGVKWHIWPQKTRETWIAPKEFEDISDEEIRNRIEEKLEDFLTGRSKEVAEALAKLELQKTAVAT